MVREGFLASNGAHIEDGSAFACLHTVENSLHTIQERQHIDVKHPLPFYRILCIQLTEQHHTGIVDHAINRAVKGFSFFDCRFHSSAVGDVHLAAQGVWQFEVFQFFQTACQQQKRMTCFGKTLGDSSSDARAGTRDNNKWFGHFSCPVIVLFKMSGQDIPSLISSKNRPFLK